jgi:CBS domain containing-hemolysin-like protein
MLYGLGMARATAAAIAGPLVLFVLTALQVILGELVPKNIGVRFPERLAVATARPMRASAILLRPLVVVLNGCGNLVLRAMHLAPGAEAIHVHRPEEIVILTKESRAGGLLDAQEQRLLQNALGWRRLSVRQVMVPRTQILTAPESLPPTQMLSVLAESPHARLVLHGGSVDDIVGTVHLKDLLWLRDGDEVADVVRTPLYVPQDARAAEVFRALQRTGTPIAVVLDEYGGTAGMTTVGDLVEVLFGHLEGEFDAEPADIALTPDDRRAIVRGDVPVRDLNERLGLFLDEAEAETVGGLVLARAGHVPVDGEVVDVGGLTITVEEMDGHAVAGVSLEVTAAQLAVWRASE